MPASKKGTHPAARTTPVVETQTVKNEQPAPQIKAPTLATEAPPPPVANPLEERLAKMEKALEAANARAEQAEKAVGEVKASLGPSVEPTIRKFRNLGCDSYVVIDNGGARMMVGRQGQDIYVPKMPFKQRLWRRGEIIETDDRALAEAIVRNMPSNPEFIEFTGEDAPPKYRMPRPTDHIQQEATEAFDPENPYGLPKVSLPDGATVKDVAG